MGNCWRKFLQCFCLFHYAEPQEKEPLLKKAEEGDESSVDPPSPVQEIPASVENGDGTTASVEDGGHITSSAEYGDDNTALVEDSDDTTVSVEDGDDITALVKKGDDMTDSVESEQSLITEHDKKFTLFGEDKNKFAKGQFRTQSYKVPPTRGSPKYRRITSVEQLIPEATTDEEKGDDTDSITGIAPTKRQLTAMELLQTETTYIRNLKIIIEIYKQPLEAAIKEGEPILAVEDIRNIFGGVSEILHVHSQIHQELSKVISEWQEDCCIAEIITKYQSQLTKAYPPYVNYFDMGKDIILKQKKSNNKFSEFLINCFNNPTCLKQPLDALLIRPVQRLPSMSLLISDLQRRTPEDLKDHKQLEKSKESLKQVLSYVNEDKRKTEGKMKIFDIIYEVESCPVEIVSSNRLFIARVNVTSLNEGLYRTGDRLALYLLTDMIEVSKFKRSPGNSQLLKHIRMLPLKDIKLVIDINDSEESQNMFAIQLVEETSEKSNVNGPTTYINPNMDKLCVCHVLDDRTYKNDFLKKLQCQIETTCQKISDEPILQKMNPSEVQPMLRKTSTRVFRRSRGKSKRE